MLPDEPTISFSPLREADLAMLHGWLKLEHVRAWWGDPNEELEQIRSILTSDDGTRGFVVHADGAPVGYIQSWRPARFRGTHWIDEAPWLAEVPEDTVGMDVFIGPGHLIERGLGTRVVRAFAAKLFADGAPRLLIDPDADNERAVRAYARAGFVQFGRHDGRDDSTILMELFPPRREGD